MTTAVVRHYSAWGRETDRLQRRGRPSAEGTHLAGGCVGGINLLGTPRDLVKLCDKDPAGNRLEAAFSQGMPSFLHFSLGIHVRFGLHCILNLVPYWRIEERPLDCESVLF